MRPGKPIENAYIESFNGRFRDECLNEHWFLTMAHARRVIEHWRIEYNTERPHSSLGDLTPEQFAMSGPEIGIGGVVTHAPLPHHRTCGSRIRRFGGFSRAAAKDGRGPASRNGHWGARPAQPASVPDARARESWRPCKRPSPNSHRA